jgi:hypothetical protein
VTLFTSLKYLLQRFATFEQKKIHTKFYKMAGGFINLIRRADKYSLYVLACLLAAYLLNQLDRYALAVTSMPMAQDIHFGDKGCVTNKSVSFSGQTKLCNKKLGSTEDIEKNETRYNLRPNILMASEIMSEVMPFAAYKL